jgi:hypothetical protein
VVPRARRQDRRGVAKLLVYLVSAAGCGAAGGVITVSSLPRGLWGVVRDRTVLGLFPVGYFVRTGESGAGVLKAVPHTNN